VADPSSSTFIVPFHHVHFHFNMFILSLSNAGGYLSGGCYNKRYSSQFLVSVFGRATVVTLYVWEQKYSSVARHPSSLAALFSMHMH
jgi:hypothetical protein